MPKGKERSSQVKDGQDGSLLVDESTPWEGRSPRELTKSYRTYSFRAEGMGRLDQDASRVGEYERELPRKGGALPSSRGVRNG